VPEPVQLEAEVGEHLARRRAAEARAQVVGPQVLPLALEQRGEVGDAVVQRHFRVKTRAWHGLHAGNVQDAF
jgi:hypothetical protein